MPSGWKLLTIVIAHIRADEAVAFYFISDNYAVSPKKVNEHGFKENLLEQDQV